MLKSYLFLNSQISGTLQVRSDFRACILHTTTKHMPASWWVRMTSHSSRSKWWELDHFSHIRINVSVLLHSYIMYIQYLQQGQAGRACRRSGLLRRTYAWTEFIRCYFILDWTAKVGSSVFFLVFFRCLMFRGRSRIRTWPTGIRS